MREIMLFSKNVDFIQFLCSRLCQNKHCLYCDDVFCVQMIVAVTFTVV